MALEAAAVLALLIEAFIFALAADAGASPGAAEGAGATPGLLKTPPLVSLGCGEGFLGSLGVGSFGMF